VSTLPISTAPFTAVRMISWVATVPPAPAFQAGMIIADAVLEERHDDESIITENPVEIGSVTNDHAYDLPQDLDLIYVWSAGSPQANQQTSFLNQMYRQFLDLKQAKILLAITTGRRAYQNMLIKGLSVITDKDSENILQIRIAVRQLILVIVQTVNVSSAAQQTIPAKTQPTKHLGNVQPVTGTNFNSGNPAGS
jgi:uncharacterized membrane protein